MIIPLFKPSFGDDEVEAVSEVLRSHWLGLGPKTAEFERRLSDYVGVDYVVALNSCTAALHIALKAMGVKEGDEVLVPAITFVSTAHAVAYCGAKPVFVDVDDVTLNMDLVDLEKKISQKTRAIVVVHYSGRIVEVDRVRKIAGKIPIVEDAAHAMGASLGSKKAGALGDIGCFSFHAVKNLATGDGGAISTNDRKIYDAAMRLRWLGIDRSTWQRANDGEGMRTYSWQYGVSELGFKYHMNDIAAALGIAQLKKLDDANRKRESIAARYFARFQDISEIKLPQPDSDYSRSSWHLFVIRVEQRDALIDYLNQRGISTGVHYYPIHLYEIFSPQPSLPCSEKVAKKILSLPLYPSMTDEEHDYVCESIATYFG